MLKQRGEGGKNQDDATIAGGELQESPPTSKILECRVLWGSMSCAKSRDRDQGGACAKFLFLLTGLDLLENQELAMKLQVKSEKKALWGVKPGMNEYPG